MESTFFTPPPSSPINILSNINLERGTCPFCNEETNDLMFHFVFCNNLSPQPGRNFRHTHMLDFLASNLRGLRYNVRRTLANLNNNEFQQSIKYIATF